MKLRHEEDAQAPRPGPLLDGGAHDPPPSLPLGLDSQVPQARTDRAGGRPPGRPAAAGLRGEPVGPGGDEHPARSCQPDHVHLPVQARPSEAVSDMVQCLKGGTSRVLRAESRALEEFLWGRSFWADGVSGRTGTPWGRWGRWTRRRSGTISASSARCDFAPTKIIRGGGNSGNAARINSVESPGFKAGVFYPTPHGIVLARLRRAFWGQSGCGRG